VGSLLRRHRAPGGPDPRPHQRQEPDDRPLPATVSIALADGAVCKPATVIPVQLVAGTTQSRMVRISAPDGVGIIEGTVKAVAGDDVRTSAIRVPFLGDPARPGPLAPGQDHRCRFLRGARTSPTPTGTGSGCATMTSGFSSILDVRSQLHALGAPGESSGGRIELYVDMRPDDQDPAGPRTATAPNSSSSRSAKPAWQRFGLEQTVSSGPAQPANGRRRPDQNWNCRLPSSSNRAGPNRERIGLDVMFCGLRCGPDRTGLPDLRRQRRPLSQPRRLHHRHAGVANATPSQ